VKVGDKLGNQIVFSRLINILFGEADSEKQKAADADLKEKSRDAFGLGALSVEDCLIAEQISRGFWEKLLTATKADEKERLKELRGELANGWKTEALPVAQVAIDRWTGGAAEGLLYSMLELKAEGECVFDLSLDTRRVPDAALALLMLTLRDVYLGRVPFGYGVNRGFGTIKVSTIEIEDPTKKLVPGGVVTLEKAEHWSQFDRLETAWKAWREAAYD
jgi:CRISPR/Cas system CSM-associated protein Csm3 (group 7 of RAMP superfamily)